MVLTVNDDVDALTLSLTTIARDCSIVCYNWPCLLPVSVRACPLWSTCKLHFVLFLELQRQRYIYIYDLADRLRFSDCCAPRFSSRATRRAARTLLSTLGLVLLSVLVPPTLACGLHTTHHGGTAVAATAIAAVVTAVGTAAA
eukprot:scaffold1894_cov120-Isochrysis_galbana.AAC.3